MIALVAALVTMGPQPGPQSLFLSSLADVAIYGGSAGAGKTFAACLETMRNYNTPGFTAGVFRRTSPQLTGAGSVWSTARPMYLAAGAKTREGDSPDATFPSGATVEFHHLQYESDVESHQGKQYALIVFEELQQFTEHQFFFMLGRLRSTCGVRPYCRATCNPDPDSFLATLIAWWIDEEGYPIPERSGVIRWLARDGAGVVQWGDTKAELMSQMPELDEHDAVSFTFVAARLDDNQELLRKDPGYRGKLRLLDRVTRLRLLGDEKHGGNWKVRNAAGMHFHREWVEVVDAPPSPVVAAVRAWDKAATKPHEGNRDPDWTRGVKIGRMQDGRRIILDMRSLRDTTGKVDDAMANTASADGQATAIACFVDPGQAGKVDESHIRKLLQNYRLLFLRPTQDKITAGGAFSARCENHQVLVQRGAWNDELFAELESIGSGSGHDDIWDACWLADAQLGNSHAVVMIDPDAGYLARDTV